MPKILLIEDNTEMRENTAELLQLSNFEVITAEHGKAGVEKAKSNHHDLDLILCDIMMPELDGYGVLRILGNLPETQNIPFIFLSAKAEKEDFRAGMTLGADDYIIKPFTEIELLDTIDKRLSKKKATDPTLNSTSISLSNPKIIDKLNEVFADKRQSSFKRKEVIFHEGDPINYIHLIRSGSVKLYKMNKDGKEMIVEILNPGSIFDLTSAYTGDEYLITSQAIEDSEVQMMRTDEFMTDIATNRVFTKYISGLLANSNDLYRNKITSIAYDSVRKRVAIGLIYCFEHCSEDAGVINISREDLANVVGTSTESVIRSLHDFKEEGLIDISGRKISLLNKPGLIQIRS